MDRHIIYPLFLLTDTAIVNGSAGQESDSDDPLYSTVKPKSKQSDPSASSQQRRGDSEEDVKGGRGAKTLKKGAKKALHGLQNIKAQGVDNKAFVGRFASGLSF